MAEDLNRFKMRVDFCRINHLNPRFEPDIDVFKFFPCTYNLFINADVPTTCFTKRVFPFIKHISNQTEI